MKTEYFGVFSGEALSLCGKKAWVVDGPISCMMLPPERTTIHSSVKFCMKVKVVIKKMLFCCPRYNILPFIGADFRERLFLQGE